MERRRQISTEGDKTMRNRWRTGDLGVLTTHKTSPCFSPLVMLGKPAPGECRLKYKQVSKMAQWHTTNLKSWAVCSSGVARRTGESHRMASSGQSLATAAHPPGLRDRARGSVQWSWWHRPSKWWDSPSLSVRANGPIRLMHLRVWSSRGEGVRGARDLAGREKN